MTRARMVQHMKHTRLHRWEARLYAAAAIAVLTQLVTKGHL